MYLILKEIGQDSSLVNCVRFSLFTSGMFAYDFYDKNITRVITWLHVQTKRATMTALQDNVWFTCS